MNKKESRTPKRTTHNSSKNTITRTDNRQDIGGMSIEERRKISIIDVAYHEAGHIVACESFGITPGWVCVETDDQGRSSGEVHRYGLPVVLREKFDQHAVISLAGPIAEYLYVSKLGRTMPSSMLLYVFFGGGGDIDAMEGCASHFGIKRYKTRCIRLAMELMKSRWNEVVEWAAKIINAPENFLIIDEVDS